MPRTAEPPPRHYQHPLVAQDFREGSVVCDGRAREHIERSLRLDYLVSDVRQLLIQEVPF